MGEPKPGAIDQMTNTNTCPTCEGKEHPHGGPECPECGGQQQQPPPEKMAPSEWRVVAYLPEPRPLAWRLFGSADSVARQLLAWLQEQWGALDSSGYASGEGCGGYHRGPFARIHEPGEWEGRGICAAAVPVASESVRPCLGGLVGQAVRDGLAGVDPLRREAHRAILLRAEWPEGGPNG